MAIYKFISHKVASATVALTAKRRINSILLADLHCSSLVISIAKKDRRTKLDNIQILQTLNRDTCNFSSFLLFYAIWHAPLLIILNFFITINLEI